MIKGIYVTDTYTYVGGGKTYSGKFDELTRANFPDFDLVEVARHLLAVAADEGDRRPLFEQLNGIQYTLQPEGGLFRYDFGNLLCHGILALLHKYSEFSTNRAPSSLLEWPR